MRTLPAAEFPDIWERGENQHPLDRALTLLAAACPEIPVYELVRLSIGQRDGLLFKLRKLTFGPRMEAFAECPVCGAQFEFDINIDDLLNSHLTPEDLIQTLKLNSFSFTFRLPDTTDLAACHPVLPDTRRQLLERCVLKATHNRRRIPLADVPEDVISGLVSRMAEFDPLSDILINLDCDQCNHTWKQQLDILSFFWNEITVHVKQLLFQVYTLARSYGWNEADILAMTAWRRQFYLDMVI